MKEIWKPIPGYEGWYAVSNLGRVRRERSGPNTFAGKILHTKPRYPRKKHGSNYCYYAVNLTKENKVRMWKVHTLVALAFLGQCPPKHEVNHIDGNATNNHVNNIEYVTHAKNLNHSFHRLKRMPWAKLTNDDVRQIRREYIPRKNSKELAERYGVHYNNIGKIARREIWKHIDP